MIPEIFFFFLLPPLGEGRDGGPHDEASPCQPPPQPSPNGGGSHLRGHTT